MVTCLLRWSWDWNQSGDPKTWISPTPVPGARSQEPGLRPGAGWGGVPRLRCFLLPPTQVLRGVFHHRSQMLIVVNQAYSVWGQTRGAGAGTREAGVRIPPPPTSFPRGGGCGKWSSEFTQGLDHLPGSPVRGRRGRLQLMPRASSVSPRLWERGRFPVVWFGGVAAPPNRFLPKYPERTLTWKLDQLGPKSC